MDIEQKLCLKNPYLERKIKLSLKIVSIYETAGVLFNVQWWVYSEQLLEV